MMWFSFLLFLGFIFLVFFVGILVGIAVGIDYSDSIPTKQKPTMKSEKELVEDYQNGKISVEELWRTGMNNLISDDLLISNKKYNGKVPTRPRKPGPKIELATK